MTAIWDDQFPLYDKDNVCAQEARGAYICIINLTVPATLRGDAEEEYQEFKIYRHSKWDWCHEIKKWTPVIGGPEVWKYCSDVTVQQHSCVGKKGDIFIAPDYEH